MVDKMHTHTTVLQLFGFCEPDEPVPEETFVHIISVISWMCYSGI